MSPSRRAGFAAALLLAIVASAHAAHADESGIEFPTPTVINGSWKMLVLSVRPPSYDGVVSETRALGGDIRFADRAVGYVRARVPEAAVARVRHLAGVDASDIFWVPPNIKASLADFTHDKVTFERAYRTGNWGSVQHPYFASQEIGLDRWRSQHPDFDGRGVVIGIADSAPDFTHPEFGDALDANGDKVPKFLDVVAASDPEELVLNDPWRDRWWIDVSQVVPVKGDTLVWRGRTYIVPHAGAYSINTFENDYTHRLASRSVLRRTAEHDATFTVLWEPATRTLWVDNAGTADFRTATPIKEYRSSLTFGELDFGASPEARMAFALQASTDARYIHLMLGVGAHGTMVSSTAAGDRRRGGLFDGVAPGAQVIAYDDGDNGVAIVDTYRQLESVLMAGRDPRVDIVSCSCGLFGSSFLQTDSQVVKHVLGRFTTGFKKPFTFAGACECSDVFSILPFNSPTMLARNLGKPGFPLATESDLEIAPPGTDGHVDPSALLPEYSLAADSRLEPWIAPYLMPPAGYMIGDGSSNATPFLAGAFADLISGAKLTGVNYDVHALQTAVVSGSRWSTSTVGEIGSRGRLLQLEPAWQALTRLAQATTLIAVSAPVRTFDGPASSGTGLVDDRLTENAENSQFVTLTPRGGPGQRRFVLRWQGNMGAFGAPRGFVAVPGKPQRIPIVIRGVGAGSHQAWLDIVDEETGVVVNTLSVTSQVGIATDVASTNRFSVPLDGLAQYVYRSAHRRARITATLSDPRLELVIFAPDNSHYLQLGQDITTTEFLPRGLSWSRAAAGGGVSYTFEISDDGPVGLWSIWISQPTNGNATGIGSPPGPYRARSLPNAVLSVSPSY